MIKNFIKAVTKILKKNPSDKEFLAEHHQLFKNLMDASWTKRYLRWGGDPNQVFSGDPILCIAIHSPDSAALLLRAGADPNLKDSRGYSAFDVVIENSNSIMSRLGSRVAELDVSGMEEIKKYIAENVDVFLNAGANVDKLDAALEAGNEFVAELLLERGAPVSADSLAHALKLGHPETAIIIARRLDAQQIEKVRYQYDNTEYLEFFNTYVEPIFQKKMLEQLVQNSASVGRINKL